MKQNWSIIQRLLWWVVMGSNDSVIIMLSKCKEKWRCWWVCVNGSYDEWWKDDHSYNSDNDDDDDDHADDDHADDDDTADEDEDDEDGDVDGYWWWW